MISVASALQQARAMIERTIDDNPQWLELSRAPLVDNGLDVMVPNPFGGRSTVEVRGRIAPLPLGVQQPQVTAAGVGVPDRHFLLVQWDADLREGDQSGYNGRVWIVGPVESIYRFGDVVALQAPLQRADEVEVST